MARTIIEFLADDPAPMPHYKKGDQAIVIEGYKNLSAHKGRRWHYKAQLIFPRKIELRNGETRGLSSLIYTTKDKIKVIDNSKLKG